MSTRRQPIDVQTVTEEQEPASASTAVATLGTTLAFGDDPAAIDRAVEQAAYFSLFSIPNPASPSTGIALIPFIPALSVGFSVHENMHRFEANVPEPSPDCGFRGSQAIGTEQVASVRMQMTPMPNNFQPGEGRVPPPTILLPFLSQRFTPLNGSFNFFDGQNSRFGAIGAGRTFPASVSGTLQTRLAAVIDATHGSGALAGLPATGIVIGDIEPPGGFHFNVMFRVMDPGGTLQTRAPLPPLKSPSNPEPGTVFMPFLAEPDPDDPLTAQQSPDGKYLFVRIVERLRLVYASFEVGPPGLRSRAATGAIVGRHSMTLILDQSLQTDVIPGFSKGGEFSFFDEDRNPIGGFKADLFEARVLSTQLPGLLTPISRIGGFAIPTEGSGQFVDPVGMVSVNGAFSLATGALSTIYMVRLSDPLGRFRLISP